MYKVHKSKLFLKKVLTIVHRYVILINVNRARRKTNTSKRFTSCKSRINLLTNKNKGGDIMNGYNYIIDTGYGFDDGRGFEHLDDFDRNEEEIENQQDE